MTFTVNDFRDMLRLLEEHPDWRAELRRMMLTEELLTLPQLVREIAEIQHRTELHLQQIDVRLEALTARVDALAEAQRQTELKLQALTERVDALTARVDELTAKLEALTARVDALAEAQRQTELKLQALTARVDTLEKRLEQLAEQVAILTKRVDELTQRMDELSQRVSELTAAQLRTESQIQRLVDRVGRLDGAMLEIKYRNRAAAFFGRLLRRARAVEMHELEALVEDRLSDQDLDDLLNLDLVVRGKWRQAQEPRPEVWLAVEISVAVDREDIERAARRAFIMRRAGLKAIPVAAGEMSTAGAMELAPKAGVILLTDGEVAFLDEVASQYL